MSKIILSWICFAMFLTFTAQGKRQQNPSAEGKQSLKHTEKLSVIDPFTKLKVDSLISLLSLEEKVALLHGIGKGNSEFGENSAMVFGIQGNKRVGIPDLIMGHGITGVRSGRDTKTHATYFCTPIAIGCSWDTQLYYQVGEALAKELRALGQDLNLGPTINIIRHPLGGRNWECFSEDPYLTSKLIVPYVKAMQKTGIICGPKHFVVNNQGKNRFDINNEVDERTLREIYLPGFKAAVKKGGALNIMGAYNRLNGVFMCQNEYLLKDILRDEWGFSGFVLSDFSKGLHSTLGAAYSGLNVEMDGEQFYGENLKQEVLNGGFSEKQLDELLFDVLSVMYRIGMFDRERREYEGQLHSEEHQQIAKTVATQSQVLLKNTNNILPLKLNEVKSIAVIGPNAKRFPTLDSSKSGYAYYLQGGGSGRSYYFHGSVIDPFTGISKKLKKKVQISYAQGCQTPDLFKKNTPSTKNEIDDKLILEAVDKAKNADVAIIYAGLSGYNETEGWDRLSASLPGQQDKLIQEVAKVNSNTIVVLIAGSYVDISPWVDQVKCILFAPYSGEKIGEGLADILVGKISPSGKLPFTWPVKVEDYPKGSIFTGGPFSEDKISNIYSEGIFVGYRWFDKEKLKVEYPFGFGLSYSTFDYSGLKAEKTGDWPVKVEFKISNTSERGGAEVAQVYVRDVDSSVDRPIKELKGFKKVFLKPGETKNISINLGQDAFSFYDTDNSKWTIESGEFEILIGSDSRNIRLKEIIAINQ